MTHQVPTRTVFTVIEQGETKSLYADVLETSTEVKRRQRNFAVTVCDALCAGGECARPPVHPGQLPAGVLQQGGDTLPAARGHGRNLSISIGTLIYKYHLRILRLH